MTKNELRKLMSRKVQCTAADCISPLEQARRLLDTNPPRITLFPDTKTPHSTVSRVNRFIRARAKALGIPVVTLTPEQMEDYR